MSVTPAPTMEWTGPIRFRPPPEPPAQTDGSKRYEGITYAVTPGYRPLQLDVWVPASPTPPPLVVWIHGGGWMFGDRRYLPETLRPNQLFEELVAADLAVATIDYRHALEAHFPAAQPPEELLAGGNDDHTLAVASPITYVTPGAPPFLLIHGTADTIVPYVQSEVLTKALSDVGVLAELVPIEGADHIFRGHDDVDGVVRISVDYLAEALRISPP
jgi:acetyl esterase/lipase